MKRHGDANKSKSGQPKNKRSKKPRKFRKQKYKQETSQLDEWRKLLAHR